MIRVELHNIRISKNDIEEYYDFNYGIILIKRTIMVITNIYSLLNVELFCDAGESYILIAMHFVIVNVLGFFDVTLYHCISFM